MARHAPVGWNYDHLNEGEKMYWDALADVAEQDPYVLGKFFLDMDLLEERIHRPMFDFMTRYERKLAESDMMTDWPLAASKTREEFTTKTGSMYERVTRSRPGVRNRIVKVCRSGLKTSAGAVTYPLWRLISNPNDGILIASLTEGFAANTLNAITQHVRQNPKILHYWTGDGNRTTGKHWYNDSPKWTTTDAIIGGRSKIGKDLSLKAVGVRAFHPGPHFKCAIVDDPIDREVVESDELSEMVAHFFTDLTPVLDPPALILVLGTPWVIYDQYALLEARDNWDVYVRSVYNPDGSLWYPERFSEQRLKDLQEEYRNDPSGFHSQYLMRPITDTEKALQLDKIHWTDEQGVCSHKENGEMCKFRRPKRENLRVVLAVDPSDAQDGAGAGSWAGWVLGADCDKNIWDLGHFKARCDVKKANDEIVKLCKLFTPDVLAIEATPVSRGYIQGTLGRVLEDNGIRTAVHEVTHGGEAKATRIANVKTGLGACIAMGRLHAREENFVLKSELNTFPSMKHMHDLLDAGTYAWRTINSLGLYPRKPEVAPKPSDLPIEMQDAYKMAERALVERDRPRRVMLGHNIFVNT